MIIVLKPNVSDESIKKIEDIIISKGVQPHVSKGEIQTIIGMVGDTTRIDPKIIEVEPEVEKVMKVSEPYKLANRAFHPDDTIVDVAGVKVGGDNLALIAGPCSVESEEQVIEIAKAAKK
ncbi:MAG: 3-deoxy-7-phosphoheptulonate synthase, partial [[Clostridium] spiroforme]|nr:3-deoxy-7-phosphoheptulonate synthase [Thomasclavelia spiroformis]